MRIGILSDTHDQVARTGRAVAALLAAGAEALIHCGDLTIPDVVAECVGAPAYFVFGNCDYDLDALRLAMRRIGATCLEQGGLIELAGRRIAVAHGDSRREIDRLAADAPDYFLSGHTHHRRDQREGPVRFLNPGALYRAQTFTVGLLDLASDEYTSLTIPR
ncbi:metallophosphoesterase family protein [Paludisphaera mucosa]|uniref:Phosphoesterase n=1 Tax=Paludisphaera mucosa TaxID=3030827 RepID=A0ABT6FKH3_9BACT|nr:YfcE family phosphodiesterase [Paludisphaera mucosa]MDG3008045.1 YfcE family phosphodiesterase [Paludisphaera mucosa]